MYNKGAGLVWSLDNGQGGMTGSPSCPRANQEITISQWWENHNLLRLIGCLGMVISAGIQRAGGCYHRALNTLHKGN